MSLTLDVPQSAQTAMLKSATSPALSPIETLICKLSTMESEYEKPSKKTKKRPSRTHAELANTASGLREISKKVSSSPIVWEAPPKTVLIVVKICDNELKVLCKQVTNWLLDFGFSVYVEDVLANDPIWISASDSDTDSVSSTPYTPVSPKMKMKNNEGSELRFWNKEYCSTPQAGQEIDFIITLGGDGTVLFAAYLFQHLKTPPPIIPFNLGSLGFLTVFEFSNFRNTIERIACDQFGVRMNFRMRFACTIKRNQAGAEDDGKTFLVLNDLVVDRGPSPFVSQLDLVGNDRLLTVVQADGLVVATPTGSTAYSLSAGGSLVHPDVSAILVTPICPHTLSFRPMLLPDTMELEIRVPQTSRATAFASFDGQHKLQLCRGDSIKISACVSAFPTVCLKDQSDDWFNALESCLGWNKRELQKSFVKGGKILNW